MSIAPLHRPGQVAESVAAAAAAVSVGSRTPGASMSTPDLAEAIAGLVELESQVQAWRLGLSAEADARSVAHQTAATGTDAWLATLTGEPRHVMAGGLWLARLLEDKYHHTREAFAAGRLRVTQVRVIVTAAERAPAGVSAAELAKAEESLVAMATGEGTRNGRAMNATRLRQAARRMFEVIDPDLADHHESDLLEAEERRAEAETWFMVHNNGDGTCSGRFTIPELHGQLLTHALQTLSSPRRLGRDTEGKAVVDETVATVQTHERYGAAFCELLEHLPTDGHGPSSITSIVTLDLESLLDGIGAARLDTGIKISAGEARRLACEAGLVPAVLGGASEPLDLGRERRLHSTAQRRALAITHDSCAVAGCERPFAWCEIHHHLLAWAKGGPTDLANALPLCGHHHRRAHDKHWDLRHHPTGDWRFHRRT